MTFRIFSVLLCLLAGLPAALAAPLSAQDEARVLYLEKRLSELEGRDRELRAYADKAAKGEADGVKDIAAAQVQGAKEGLVGQLAGLSSNYNMLLGFGTAISALLITIFGVGAWFAKREARSVAEAEMRAMDGKLEAKEQKVLNALQKKADDLIKIIETAKQQAQEHAEAAGESRAKAEKEAKASSDLVKRSSTAVLSVDERIKADALKEKFKNIPPQDLNKEQLIDLIEQALADDLSTEAARYAAALASKEQSDPYPLILLSRSRLDQGLLFEAVDAARRAIENAQEQHDPWAEGVARIDLGDALRGANNLLEAKESYQRGHKLFEEIGGDFPEDLDVQRQIAVGLGRLGDVLLEIGLEAEAAEAHQKDLEIASRLASSNPENIDRKRDFEVALRRYAKSIMACGGVEKALPNLQKAQEIADILLSDSPMKPIYRQDAARLKAEWGDYHEALGNHKEARRLWGEAIKELGTLEENKTLHFLGRRALKEYRDKLAAA